MIFSMIHFEGKKIIPDESNLKKKGKKKNDEKGSDYGEIEAKSSSTTKGKLTDFN